MGRPAPRWSFSSDPRPPSLGPAPAARKLEPTYLDNVRPFPSHLATEAAPRVEAAFSAEVDEQVIPDDPAFRYEDLGPIAEGGMGEVRRVRDRDLNRVVAMKIGHDRLMQDRHMMARFIAEAQATAQLAHPGIVPVHELGVLPDGRFYFTMKEVNGKTLRNVIDALHEARCEAGTMVDEHWRLHRVVDALHDVCEAIAYAHARGVVHRDLKPDNVMVGRFGEVLVLDWGIAKVMSDPAGAGPVEGEPIVTNRSTDPGLCTQGGLVAGTPYYMPPEQARGQFQALGPAADVYALGAILYEVLHGIPPYFGVDRRQLLDRIAEGNAVMDTGGGPAHLAALRAKQGWPMPAGLVAICRRALQPRPEDRYADAGQLADDIRAWREGVRNRDKALEMVNRARGLQPTVAVLRRQAQALSREAHTILGGLGRSATAEDKAVAWDLQDQAAVLEKECAIRETEALQLLHGAVSHVPSMPEAHELLADHYQERHARAERGRQTTLAARYEALLRAHDRGKHHEYLEGLGRVTLRTTSRARVSIYRYEERGRRLVPVSLNQDMTAPLRSVALQSGSYLMVVRSEGHAEVRYPVFIGRQEHWDGVAHGETEPQPVHQPAVDELGNDECYVPAGWFLSGEEPDASAHRRTWIGGFAVKRTQVTYREYVAFLNDLVDRGQAQRARALEPGQAGPDGAIQSMLHRGPNGRYSIPGIGAERDRMGRWPVSGVDRHCADAYASWLAERTGQPWRLPTEGEWEKAARGVDGRRYPWGDFFDPSFCCMRDSRGCRPGTSEFDDFRVDESPYGVRGMAGMVSELCAGPVEGDDDACVVRGGSWKASAHDVRIAARSFIERDRRSARVGFRLVRSLEQDGR